MKRIRQIAIALGASATLLAGQCADNEVRAYLANDLNPWLIDVGQGVCNLEHSLNPPAKAPSLPSPPASWRFCPGGPGDQVTPPPPPPPK